jgi:hypothetical protein
MGTLVHTVTPSEAAPNWTFGIRALMDNLVRRGLLAPEGTRQCRPDDAVARTGGGIP